VPIVLQFEQEALGLGLGQAAALARRSCIDGKLRDGGHVP
jgi:hypothetical protein